MCNYAKVSKVLTVNTIKTVKTFKTMAYTTMDGKIVPVWSVPSKPSKPKVSYSFNEDTIVKMRELKKALVQLLMSKKHLMDEDERMEFLKLDEHLYNWINNISTRSSDAMDIEDVVVRAVKVLKSYGKHVSMS